MIASNTQQQLIEFGNRLKDAKHGTKADILKEAMDFFGWSRDTFYRNLEKLGFDSGRKRRKDAGKTEQNEEALHALAAMTKASARANGKTLMETENAISVLSQNGYEFKSVSTVNRLLRQRNLTAKQLKQDSTHGHFKTEHANQVHMVDPSLCVLYYPPNRKGVKIQSYTTFEEHYKNKPEQLEKIKHLRVWRYVMIDHYSGLIAVRYYECAGESQDILYDFLLWAWGKLSGSPFHGMPHTLYWDKGSANTSKAIKHALGCLTVEAVAHTTHLARAKGAVEKANDIVERSLEGRLLFEPVDSVEHLNQVAVKWQNAFNANKIPNYNALHSRHGLPRTDAWLTIMRPENIHHLRELPSVDYCRYIFTHEPVARTVKGDLEISFVHPMLKKSLRYSLANLHGVHAKQKVLVSPIVIGDEAKVLVRIAQPLGDDIIHEVAPQAFDEMGFRVDSPVFGQGFDTKQDTVLDANQKAMDRVAYPDMSDEEIEKAKKKKLTPFNGEIDAISHIANLDLPAAITPRGANMDLPNEFQPEEAKPLSRIAAKRLVTNKLGRDLDAHESELISNYGDIFESDITNIVELILNPRQALKLVK
ncbi:integrase [Thalassotalea loyana]|uniref:Integrase n=1 Tax=Thalassotalea loyana TaxID=280483 RepID=A0ABQ6HEC6_9GAMM|nr:hypothetical protein [Thalassotalea loyana]GLX86339.1 integrase [Thalassotalea loyana]